MPHRAASAFDGRRFRKFLSPRPEADEAVGALARLHKPDVSLVIDHHAVRLSANPAWHAPLLEALCGRIVAAHVALRVVDVPDLVVRRLGEATGIGVLTGQFDFGELHRRRIDRAELVGAKLREPRRAVVRHDDAVRAGPRRGHFDQVDRAIGWREVTDEVAALHREPDGAVGRKREGMRIAGLRIGHLEAFDTPGVRIEAADVGVAIARKPNGAALLDDQVVRPGALRQVVPLEGPVLVIQRREIVAALPHEPDSSLRADVGVAGPRVFPRHGPLGDGDRRSRGRLRVNGRRQKETTSNQGNEKSSHGTLGPEF